MLAIDAAELSAKVARLAVATLLARHGLSDDRAVELANEWQVDAEASIPPAVVRKARRWLGLTSPTSSAPIPAVESLETRLHRARRYIAKMPPAISEQGGHAALWAVALTVVRGFDVPIEHARPVLEEYSARCVPPWSARELEHKLEDASDADAEPGYLLRDKRERVTVRTQPDLAAVADDVASALAARTDVNLYQRAGLLVRLVDVRRPPSADVHERGVLGADGVRRPEGAPAIHAATPPAVRETVARACRFTKLNKKGIEVEVPAPRDVVEMFAARGSWDLPILESVAEVPRLRPDGTVIQAPGLDAVTGVFYRPCADYAPVPERPTREDAIAALETLDYPLAEFVFVEPHDRSAALAAALTIAAGPAIQGPRPMFEIGASTPGEGKGLLVDAVSIIGAGRAPACMSPARDEDESRKTILSLALDGTQVILLDNATGTVGTPSLAMALTAGEVRGRVLGLSRIATVPISATWLITGNGLSYAKDLARRVVRIAINAGLEHPEDRKFREADLRAYCRRERPRLAIAALTVLRAHAVAGRPQHGGPRKGSFTSWDDVVRSALIWAGRPDPARWRRGAARTGGRRPRRAGRRAS